MSVSIVVPAGHDRYSGLQVVNKARIAAVCRAVVIDAVHFDWANICRDPALNIVIAGTIWSKAPNDILTSQITTDEELEITKLDNCRKREIISLGGISGEICIAT